jgi:hypothetical protein
MKKSELITYLTADNVSLRQAAKRLGWAGDRADNAIWYLPEELTDKQSANIIRRMKAARWRVPKEWQS